MILEEVGSENRTVSAQADLGPGELAHENCKDRLDRNGKKGDGSAEKDLEALTSMPKSSWYWSRIAGPMRVARTGSIRI